MRKLFLSLALVSVLITAYGCSNNCKNQCNAACEAVKDKILWILFGICDVCRVEIFLDKQNNPVVCNAQVGVKIQSDGSVFFSDPPNSKGAPRPQQMDQVGTSWKRTLNLNPCISKNQLSNTTFMDHLKRDSRINLVWCEKDCSWNPTLGNLMGLDLLSAQQSTSWHFRKSDCVLEIHVDADRNGNTLMECIQCCR